MMDRNKCSFFILLLVTTGLLALTDAQIFGRLGRRYGRGRIFAPRRSFYPRFPAGHGHLVDPYVQGPFMETGVIGDPYARGGVLPVVGGVYPEVGGVPAVIGGLRQPAVVDNQSNDRVGHINIQNNNDNQRIQTGSGNVRVNQVTGGNGNQCEPCPADGYCTGGRVCQYSQTCPNDVVCV